MEMALVSAATGALKPVMGKLAALLGHEYKRFKGVRKEIKSLTHELTAMDAFLLKMSEEEDLDVQDKVWMNEVRELSYDMEDCIDDFMLCIDEKDTKPDGFLDKIKNSLGKMKTRRRIGSEIHDLKKQIIEVGERNARYKTRQAFSNTNNATVDPRALAIFKHASKLVGIDEPKAELIKMLIEEDGVASMQPQQVKMVSIVGSGGMGKTTLANQVYQDLKGKFECRAFMSVSRNPDMMNILRIILSQVSREDYHRRREYTTTHQQDHRFSSRQKAIKAEVILDAQGLWEVVCPADGAAVDEKKNKMAGAQLFGALSDDILMQVSTKKTVKEVWDNLKTRFVGADRVKAARLSTLRGEFDKLRMEEGELLDDYAGKISGMAARYAGLGSTLGEETPRHGARPVVLRGGQDRCDVETMAFKEALSRLKAFDERSRRRTQAGGERSDGQLLLTVDQWEARRRQRGGGHDHDDGDGGSSVASGARRRCGKCYNCGVHGHFSRDCRQPRKEKALLADDEPALL